MEPMQWDGVKLLRLTLCDQRMMGFDVHRVHPFLLAIYEVFCEGTSLKSSMIDSTLTQPTYSVMPNENVSPSSAGPH